MKNKTYHIVTFGCQMNERDSETLAGMLEDLGYEWIEEKTQADVVILNTCSVRENADKRFLGVLGQLNHPKAQRLDMVVAICGCMMQQQHVIDMLNKKYPWVDLIFGTHNIHRFPALLHNVREDKSQNQDIWPEGGAIVENLPAKRMSKFKAYVNIMYGCNNFCTYCIVPYTRGRERSRNPQEILNEIQGLAESGTKEITLLGQNVNSYGKALFGSGSYYIDQETDQIDFSKLIRKIDKISGIERIRFMTSHPKDISDDLIAAYGECAHLCKHIHLPIQSGSNNVLRRMNRRYTTEQYILIIEKLRKTCPQIAITTDIIVGFPGESDRDFQDTLELVKQLRYDSAFTFLFSIRKGTPAAQYEDQISEELKHERFDVLVDAIHKIQAEKNNEYKGKISLVLVEGPSRTNSQVYTGRTDSAKVVNFLGTAERIGEIVPVKITKAQTFSLYGEIQDTL
ncbi:MAG: tRNA (N6-isopentenyl adenosine(37)-C2)-methylthiotransferase MiaB [Clostridia bacterium]|nr:tRNA (N6-isopentenyl adenosine(37)-C2)-methylthiotransferase MiaB [Clostridia bacterium]